jgi:transcriptional regulator with XRE-family HTH domain
MPNRMFDHQKVKATRQAIGLTRDVLAQRAGLTADGIMKIEQGRRTPRADTMVRLADALGIKTDELFR